MGPSGLATVECRNGPVIDDREYAASPQYPQRLTCAVAQLYCH